MATNRSNAGRPAAAARLLQLAVKPDGDHAIAFQIIEAILDRRGELRIVRVGTATVAVAGTELGMDEVGGDGPNTVEAIVAVACDLVRFDEMRARFPVELEPTDEPDPQGTFAW